MQYENNDYKLIAVLSRTVTPGRQANVLGHITMGLAVKLADLDALRFDPYVSLEGEACAPLISRYPFIELSARNSSHLRNQRRDLEIASLPVNCFYQQMVGRSAQEQLACTARTLDADLDYLGLVTFGPKTILDPLTRKLSLYAGQASGT
jgi:hypothetical protein